MFRPCIDLHNGKVKQIVGGSLNDEDNAPATNFTSEKPSQWYAGLYKNDNLSGGHVIRLGKGNEEASINALKAYPGGLQIGGGVNNENATGLLEAGASEVIVTSFVFKDGILNEKNLDSIVKETGKEKLVLDLSCRIKDDKYWIVTDRWQNFTSLELTTETMQQLSSNCCEFLIHAVDVEGLCQGIDWRLVEMLKNSPIPVTYAGGARSIDDLIKITEISDNKVDLTIGSALDIFGGNGITYKEAIDFNNKLKLS
ncbi:MAG: phosphoribosylformimino-5-aminoimidazole carboxamide ribotide isomerase [Lentisphaerales bacterium]|nr:phosphoribosylformimino-5-aminoimidazole carboxamide ribotide isomerase [Lentisphaerales bacterium]